MTFKIVEKNDFLKVSDEVIKIFDKIKNNCNL